MWKPSIALCLIGASLLCHLAYGAEVAQFQRIKRQAGSNAIPQRNPNGFNAGASLGLNVGDQGNINSVRPQAGASLGASAGSLATASRVPTSPVQNSRLPPATSPSSSAQPIGNVSPQVDRVEPVRETDVPPRRRRPNRRPSTANQDDDLDDYDDSNRRNDRLPVAASASASASAGGRRGRWDDYTDYGYYDDFNPYSPLHHPLRQFESLVGGVFGGNPFRPSLVGSLLDGDYLGNDYFYNDGGNYASAASSVSNGGDGRSRVTGTVTNNGRTRGFVTDTRDGRSKTQRFGDYEDDY